MGMLRWQKDAFESYKNLYDRKSIFVQIAGTASGKTALGSSMAAYAFMREAERDPLIIVAVPFRGIKKGWQRWLKSVGISRTTTDNNSAADSSLQGIICTYASLGEMVKMVKIWDRPVILVLDEFHHLEENGKWASAIADEVVSDSSLITRAILLSGTPWHETGSLPGSIVEYDDNDFVIYDHMYSYGDAVNEDDPERNVVPVEFHLIDGVAYQKGIDAETGDEIAPRTFDTKSMSKDDPLTPFVDFGASSIYQYDAATALIDRAVQRLDMIRSADGTEYVGGMFIAMATGQAEAIKRYLENVHGKEAVLVTSDDPKAHEAIESFSNNHDQEWIVSINMIAEGVDVPRIKVQGDLTNKKTLLHIIQRWGRTLRRVRKPDNSFAINSSAYIYAINHPFIREQAQRIEEEVRQAKKKKTNEPGEPPPATVSYITERQEFSGEDTIAHGEEIEARVADLAQWLWNVNYRGIRKSRRGHTDCVFLARNYIADNNIPKGYTEPKREEASRNERSYDDEKSDAIEELSRVTASLAFNVFDGDFKRANFELSNRMGFGKRKKWVARKQPIEVIHQRIELAKWLMSQWAA